MTLQLNNGADTGAPTRTLHNISFFVNNTALQPRSAMTTFHQAGNDDLLLSNLSVTHTIMYMNGGHGDALLDSTRDFNPNHVDPDPGTIDYNLLYRDVDKATDAIFGTRLLDAHTISGDPLFADPASGDYTLQMSSPAFKVGFLADGVPLEPF